MQKEIGNHGSGQPRNGSFLPALGCSMVLHVCLLLAFSMQGERVQNSDPKRQSIPVTLVAGSEPSPQSDQTRHLPPAAAKVKTAAAPEPTPLPAVRPTIKLAKPETAKVAEAKAAGIVKPRVQEPTEPAPNKLIAQEPRSAPTETAQPADRPNTPAALPGTDKAAVEKKVAKREGNQFPPTRSTAKADEQTAAGPSPGEQGLPAAKEREIVRAEPAAATRNAYQEMLRQRIERYKIYPRMARRGNQQGTARIFFALDRQGRLTGCRLEQSSGHRLLDQAAMKAVRAGAPYPPLPEELLPQSAEASFVIPVTFVLER